jgi:hypothetical protein
MRYVGAAIGLSMEYFPKYQLDKNSCLWSMHANLGMGEISLR